MSHSRHRHTEKRTVKTPIAPSSGARAGKKVKALGVVGMVMACVLVLAGWWAWNARRQTVALPVIDWTAMDPVVVATLKQHQDTVRQNPRSGSAWGWLGALLWTYDYRPQACECLSEAVRLEPDNPRWPYYHGLALLIAQPAEAAVKFREAAHLCGVDPEAPRFRLVRVLAELGHWDEVQRELEPLLRLKPDFTPAQLIQARMAHARSNLTEAIELARGCVEDPRTTRSAWALLAILYRQHGDLAAAAQAAQRSTASPTDQGFGDPFEAEVHLRRNDPRVLSEQAHPLLAAGHLKTAANLIDQLVRQHPAHPETWLLHGRLLLLQKDAVQAEKSFRHHLELSPQSVQGFFQLGLALLNQNRFAEAARVFEQATQLKTDYGPAYFNRGLALARSEQPREAMAAFKESLRHNPERIDTYFLLADLHLKFGEKTEAARLLDQAEAIQPKDRRLLELRRRILP